MGLKGVSTVLQYKNGAQGGLNNFTIYKWGSRGSPQFHNIKMGLKGVSTVLQYKNEAQGGLHSFTI